MKARLSLKGQCLKWLSLREHSKSELRRKLLRHALAEQLKAIQSQQAHSEPARSNEASFNLEGAGESQAVEPCLSRPTHCMVRRTSASPQAELSTTAQATELKLGGRNAPQPVMLAAAKVAACAAAPGRTSGVASSLHPALHPALRTAASLLEQGDAAHSTGPRRRRTARESEFDQPESDLPSAVGQRNLEGQPARKRPAVGGAAVVATPAQGEFQPWMRDRDSLEAEVDSVIAWLEEKRYLDEARFVESRVTARLGRHGAIRIRQELAQHGLSLDAQTADHLRETEFERAWEVWRRKFASQGLDLRDPRARAKQARFLTARGFGADVIRQVLRRAEQERDLG